MSQRARARQETAVSEGDFIRDVRDGLGNPIQKQLPAKYFYDDVGSALFEAITRLPEYGLTRADESLIHRHASDIVSHLDRPTAVAELGSGSGMKTRRILREIAGEDTTDYFPIDISVGALERCQSEIGQLGNVCVTPLASGYIDGLREAVRRLRSHYQLLVLFLGSTLGNFPRVAAQAFLSDIHDILRPGDLFLLGTDLVKPVPQLLAAYDDATGVTAAFNKNLLARINRELAGDFDLDAFHHVVRYDEAHRRVEMHLRSESTQRVEIQAAGMTVDFASGETIWTESSHKFLNTEVIQMGFRTGFSCTAQWIDDEWPFAETLLVAH